MRKIPRLFKAAFVFGGVLALGTALSVTYDYFSPGGALSGTWNSQNVNVGAGAPFITGRLPYANTAQGSALSVLGVTGNAPADNASIVAASDAQILRRSGTAVGFGSIDLSASGTVGSSVLGTGNGGLGLSAAADDNIAVGNGTLWQSKALSSCSGASDAVTYNATTNTFGCNTISSGGTTIRTAIKSGDTGRTAVTILADPDLTLSSVAAGTYIVSGGIHWAPGAGQFNVGISCSNCSAVNTFGAMASGGTAGGAGTPISGNIAISNTTTTTNWSQTSSTPQVTFFGLIVVSSTSTVNLQWGLNSASGTTTLLGGSWISLTPTS